MSDPTRALAWLVDDSRAVLRLLERQLTLKRVAVRLFDAAKPCLDALAACSDPRHHPSLIVIDRHLADADGIDLGAQARSSGYRGTMALFTATHDGDTAAVARARGFDVTLPKPLDADSLAWLATVTGRAP
ncbi:MAG: hypothetical protein C0475_01990 [Planctomyces sp.]|nr:hypothetical protein [Planctomyces sp.]